MKYLKLKPEDFEGKYDVKIDLSGTVPYHYFFKKIKNKVYRYSKMGNEDWREDLMPFNEIPFTIFP